VVERVASDRVSSEYSVGEKKCKYLEREIRDRKGVRERKSEAKLTLILEALIVE
jgi:hypothetical protein